MSKRTKAKEAVWAYLKEDRIMKIAVLFDGAGLSRLGLEQAGNGVPVYMAKAFGEVYVRSST